MGNGGVEPEGVQDDPGRTRAGRRRRLVRVGVGLVLFLSALELASFGAYRVIAGEWFRPREAAAARERVVSGGGEAPGSEAGTGEAGAPGGGPREELLRLRDQVLHPYVGYVLDAAALAGESFAGRQVGAHGFLGEAFPEPGPERLVVGIAGGSLAFFFAEEGAPALARALQADRRFAGKEIELVVLALPGHKQPQQLFSFLYLSLQGCRLNWLVNLDGFNEVALPVVENEPRRVAAIFPRSWFERVSGTADAALVRRVGELAFLRRQRVRAALAGAPGPLAWSPTWNLVWRLRDERLAREIARAENDLLDGGPGEERYVAQGPYREPGSEEELYDELVRIWSESSLWLHRSAEARGVRYLHVLQPNQYLAGTKPMGAQERRLAVSQESRFRVPVERGYPRLIEAGEALSAAGVRFVDLTRVFEDVEEPLYADNCCHLNEAGYRLLGEAIAAEILATSR